MRCLTPCLAILLLLPAYAPAAEGRMPVAGDCALFREGGEGAVLKAPSYWLKATIIEVYRRPHRVSLCPDPGKPKARYSRDDWKRLADAWPCVDDAAKVHDTEVIRIRMRADQWDTPWVLQHGHNGWLFRGHFLDTELKPGVVIDIDGSLLERCDALP